MSALYSTNLSNAVDIDSSGSTAETDTELVAAVASQKVKVAYIFFTTDQALLVTFESSTTTEKFILTPAANGGANILAPPGLFLFETAAGESLTYTTNAGAKHLVYVAYSQGA